MELPLDKKSDHVAVLDDRTLRECFDGNPTKTDEKKSLEIEWKCVHCSQSVHSEQTLKTHMAKKHNTLGDLHNMWFQDILPRSSWKAPKSTRGIYL